MTVEDTRYRKKAVTNEARRALAHRHGLSSEGRIVARCAHCPCTGTIQWWPGTRGWVTFQYLEIDHVIPEFRGGDGQADNLQLLCLSCNRRKGHHLEDK